MFYSHEVLTSREHGVATVWLVATLGSRSILKKVGRKDILQVNVDKACRTIVDPGAPMALRLQGSLLFGVSRVYLEQCNYVLNDVQSAHNHIRHMLQVTHSSQLDTENRRLSRPELLLLEDDPAYLPDLDSDRPPSELLNPGLITDNGSSIDRVSSPHTPRNPRHVRDKRLDQLGIIIPSSPSGGLSDLGGGFDFPSSASNSHVTRVSGLQQALAETLPDKDYDPIPQLPEGDFFDFDPSGAIIDPDVQGIRQNDDIPAIDNATSDAVLDVDRMDLDIPQLGEEGGLSANAGAATQHDSTFAAVNNAASGSLVQGSELSAPQNVVRRPRKREIAVDRVLEVRSSELRRWSEEYIANMAEASKKRQAHQASHIAKRNAEFWVWQSGLGGTGSILGSLGRDHPLHAFHGDQLKQTFLGIGDPEAAAAHGMKRTSPNDNTDVEEGIDAEGRRVRSRHAGADAELARGGDLGANNYGNDFEEGLALPDDAGIEVEVGRRAATPLADGAGVDPSSTMPWNVSTGSHPKGPGSRRTVSASPLARHSANLRDRGSRYGSISSAAGGIFPDPPSSSAGGPLDDYQDELSIPGDEYQQVSLGATAGLSPKIAKTSQSERIALDQETSNFLNFATNRIQEMNDSSDQTGQKNEISFEDLLPPAQSGVDVAAQGLLHVLALGSKGLFDVKQETDFGEILLTPTGLEATGFAADS